MCAEIIAPELRWSIGQCTGKHIFDVTGPAVISHNTLAQSISDITGLDLSRNLVTLEELERDWLDSGIPPSVAQTSNHFDKDAAQGYHIIVSSTVEDLSGYKPVSPFDYL
ncbi:hypothetical protein CFAM422_008713 [Trichoderma lentiforme]|uniref:Uncharacterized protein n=1 Tax=Trichoderma lentiforme TaxID=1567552 RepID=A0A9P5CC59_9HYPO|nr:hypothetical protein CFAM422_008713 [Trichoderma lentiforme]